MHAHPPGNGKENPERKVTYFATTHTRGKREMFGIQLSTVANVTSSERPAWANRR